MYIIKFDSLNFTVNGDVHTVNYVDKARIFTEGRNKYPNGYYQCYVSENFETIKKDLISVIKQDIINHKLNIGDFSITLNIIDISATNCFWINDNAGYKKTYSIN